MDKINIPTPGMWLRPKTNEKDSLLALTDFLSHKENKDFAEKYVKELMKSTEIFPQELSVINDQSHGEADIFDSKNNVYFEVKTLWGQNGCKLLSSLTGQFPNEKIEQAFMELQLYNNLDKHFNSALTLTDLPKEISSIEQKMKKKKNCDWVLYYPFSFELDNDETIPATDIDAKLWQNIIKKNNLDFKIYMIKPTIWKEFRLTTIDKNRTSLPLYFKYNNFFEDYVVIDWSLNYFPKS